MSQSDTSNHKTGKPKTMLVMAGGTGGHVFPALATADELRELGVDIQWLGSIKGIENELVPKAGIKLHTISVAGLRGKGKLSLLLAPLKLIRAVWQAIGVLRDIRPVCVLGMGGFASGPGGVAAWLMGIPVLIHEQNAIPGMTNKVLARVAKQVLEAFPGAFEPQYNALCTGNPIRKDIVNLKPPHKRMAERSGPIKLLIVGGSLGAKAINEVVPKALALLPVEARPMVRHQVGKRNYEEACALYQRVDVTAQVDAFIDDMNAAYEWADLVLCRAGALTVSELCAAGVASILVPYPHAVDDHQTQNARYITRENAGVLVPQEELTEQRLLSLLNELNDRERLQTMAEIARGLARVDASQRVAEQCLMSAAGVKCEG